MRLDGLAGDRAGGARIRILSPSELLARLERRLPLLSSGAIDLPSRQRTLRSTINWSYELLNPDEQRLFRHISIFARSRWRQPSTSGAGSVSELKRPMCMPTTRPSLSSTG